MFLNPISFSFFQIFQSFILLKIAFLIILVLYSIFALVVVQQIHTMNSIIKQPPFASIVNIISWLHFAASISLFLFALAIL